MSAELSYNLKSAVGVYQFLAVAAAALFPGTVHDAITNNSSPEDVLKELKRIGLTVDDGHLPPLMTVINSLKTNRAKVAEMGTFFGPLVNAAYGGVEHRRAQYSNLFGALKTLERSADLHAAVHKEKSFSAEKGK